MHRFMLFLKSLRLSLGLLIILLPIIAAANLVPQTGRVSPQEIDQWQAAHPFWSEIASLSGFHHVYTSSWFLLLTCLLFCNLTIITWQLTRRTFYKSRGLHRFTAQGPDYLTLATLPLEGGLLAAFEQALRRKKYSLIKVGGELYGRKGWLGIWGGSLLHIGLVIIIIGAICSGMTRFSGYVELGEGQEVQVKDDLFQQADNGPLFQGHRPGASLLLDSTEQEQGRLMTVPLAKVTARLHSSSVTEVIRPNQPLEFHGLRIFLGRQGGPALLFSVIGPGGINSGFVNLQRESGQPAVSLFPIANTPMQAQVTYVQGEQEVSLEVRERETLLFQGPLLPRQSLRLGQWTLTLLDIRTWAGFIVVSDWAVPIVFLGFWLAVAGVLLMAIFDPREIWLQIPEGEQGKELRILGWGRWKNMFKEEFKEIRYEVDQWSN